MPLDNMLQGPAESGTSPAGYPYRRQTESVGYSDHMNNGNGVEIPSLHVSKIMWPLEDREEAELLRHYISYISKWVSLFI